MEDTRSRAPSPVEGLACLACRAEADARVAEVLLCAECLGRHHPTCWAGACAACGGTDALPVRAAAPAPGLTIRVVPPTPRRRGRVRKLRVAMLVAFCAAFAASFQRAQPQPAPQAQPLAVARAAPEAVLLPPLVDVDTHPEPARVQWLSDDARVAAAWNTISDARVRTRRGDHRRALAIYDRAIEIGPEIATAWVERSRTRGALGDQVGARADAVRATELDPNSRTAWFQRGFRGGELGLWKEAEADWTRTLELTPNDVWPWNNRGFVRAHGDDPQGAIADCTRAIELEPGVAYAWNNRAWAKWRLGDVEGAWADVTRSLELDPNNAWAYETRARVGLELGHSAAEVRGDLERCLALDASYPRAGLVRDSLRELSSTSNDRVDPADELRKAVEAVEAGRFEETEVHLRNILESQPDHEQALRYRDEAGYRFWVRVLAEGGSLAAVAQQLLERAEEGVVDRQGYEDPSDHWRARRR